MTRICRATLFLSSLAVLAATAPCQRHESERVEVESRADARADARGGDTRRVTHTVTHRVVVVNGKTVVDERTENGKPVKSFRRGPVGGIGRRVDRGVDRPSLPAMPDPQETLRRMKEQLERELGRELPLGGFDEPMPPRRAPIPKPADAPKPAEASKPADASKLRKAKQTGNAGSRRAPGRLEPRRRLR